MNISIDPTWYCPGCNRLTCRCNDYLDEDPADLDDEPDGIAYDPVEPCNGPRLWPDEDDLLPF